MWFRRLLLTISGFLTLTSIATADEDWNLIGTWVFTEARVAPWTGESYRSRAMDQAKELLQKEITFTPKAVEVKHHTLACTKPVYEKTAFPPDIVFQSGLPGPDRAKQARDLGLRDDLTPGVDLTCATGIYSYHFVDRRTALLGFNDVVYTLKRKPK